MQIFGQPLFLLDAELIYLIDKLFFNVGIHFSVEYSKNSYK
jgi:hypothetical protein